MYECQRASLKINNFDRFRSILMLFPSIYAFIWFYNKRKPKISISFYLWVINLKPFACTECSLIYKKTGEAQKMEINAFNNKNACKLSKQYQTYASERKIVKFFSPKIHKKLWSRKISKGCKRAA